MTSRAFRHVRQIVNDFGAPVGSVVVRLDRAASTTHRSLRLDIMTGALPAGLATVVAGSLMCLVLADPPSSARAPLRLRPPDNDWIDRAAGEMARARAHVCSHDQLARPLVDVSAGRADRPLSSLSSVPHGGAARSDARSPSWSSKAATVADSTAARSDAPSSSASPSTGSRARRLSPPHPQEQSRSGDDFVRDAPRDVRFTAPAARSTPAAREHGQRHRSAPWENRSEVLLVGLDPAFAPAGRLDAVDRPRHRHARRPLLLRSNSIYVGFGTGLYGAHRRGRETG